MYAEVIDVKNGNTLVALAYITTNSNPYEVFCNFILYCLDISKSKQLRHDELSSLIQDEFGLKFPNNILSVCIRLLRKNNDICVLPNGQGYKLISKTFDLRIFTSKRHEFDIAAKSLIEDMQNYMSNEFSLEWTYEETQEALMHFLIERENVYDIFVNKTVDQSYSSTYISNDWFVGKYISNILESKSVNSSALINVVQGLMVYIGISQMDDYNQNHNQRFNGTEFYFDTRLVLRVLGFSWNLAVESARELCNVLTDIYGATLCVFEHTVCEIEHALKSAASEIKGNKNHLPNDRELAFYFQINGLSAEDFELHAISARKVLTGKFGFRIKESHDWNDNKENRHYIGHVSLEEFIQREHPSWKRRAISNDVSSINEINILRKGDYSERFGGRKKLPIFITTNSALVSTIRKYIEQDDTNDNIANWRTNALPIITESMLVSRLWCGSISRNSELPKLTLARDAYAAQMGDDAYFGRIRVEAKKLFEKHSIEYLSVPDVVVLKLENALVKNSGGDVEQLEGEIVAMSYEEAVLCQENAHLQEISSQKEVISELENKSQIKDDIIESYKEGIINSFVERHKDKFGFWKLLIGFCRAWSLLPTIIFGVIEFVLNLFYSSSQHKALTYIWGAFIVLLPTIILVFDNYIINSKRIERALLNKFQPLIVKKYKEMISRNITSHEMELKDRIITACLQSSKTLTTLNLVDR